MKQKLIVKIFTLVILLNMLFSTKIYALNSDNYNLQLPNNQSSSQTSTKHLTSQIIDFFGSDNKFNIALLKIGISIIFVVIAFRLWKKYGKDETTDNTMRFYPPDGLNCADLGFIYKGHSKERDILPLLLNLANRGYLKFEEFEINVLNMIKSRNFKIVKIKDYDGNSDVEKIFFDGLFEERDEVTIPDLENHFYVIIKTISAFINRKENQEEIFEKKSLSKRIFFIAMIVIVFFFMTEVSIFQSGILIGLSILIAPLAALYIKPNTSIIIFSSLFLVTLGFLSIENDIFLGDIYLFEFIIESICLVLLMTFFGIIKKRTLYGTEMFGRIQGFKNFLETAEKSQLDELIMKDPDYFYEILPYTYVLGISNKWIKKFDDSEIKAPKWYFGLDSNNDFSFSEFLKNAYTPFSRSMLLSFSGRRSHFSPF